MFCHKCGSRLEDNAVKCSKCGAPVRIRPSAEKGNTADGDAIVSSRPDPGEEPVKKAPMEKYFTEAGSLEEDPSSGGSRKEDGLRDPLFYRNAGRDVDVESILSIARGEDAGKSSSKKRSADSDYEEDFFDADAADAYSDEDDFRSEDFREEYEDIEPEQWTDVLPLPERIMRQVREKLHAFSEAADERNMRRHMDRAADYYDKLENPEEHVPSFSLKRIKTEFADPAKAVSADPAKAEAADPAKTAGPAKTAAAGTEKARPADPVKAETADPAKAAAAGAEKNRPAGPAKAETANPAKAAAAGAEKARPAGPAKAETAGPAKTEPAGPAGAEQAASGRPEQAVSKRPEQAVTGRTEQAGPAGMAPAGSEQVRPAGPASTGTNTETERLTEASKKPQPRSAAAESVTAAAAAAKAAEKTVSISAGTSGKAAAEPVETAGRTAVISKAVEKAAPKSGEAAGKAAAEPVEAAGKAAVISKAVEEAAPKSGETGEAAEKAAAENRTKETDAARIRELEEQLREEHTGRLRAEEALRKERSVRSDFLMSDEELQMENVRRLRRLREDEIEDVDRQFGFLGITKKTAVQLVTLGLVAVLSVIYILGRSRSGTGMGDSAAGSTQETMQYSTDTDEPVPTGGGDFQNTQSSEGTMQEGQDTQEPAEEP